jgi:hypothetical protein
MCQAGCISPAQRAISTKSSKLIGSDVQDKEPLVGSLSCAEVSFVVD